MYVRSVKEFYQTPDKMDTTFIFSFAEVIKCIVKLEGTPLPS